MIAPTKTEICFKNFGQETPGDQARGKRSTGGKAGSSGSGASAPRTRARQQEASVGAVPPNVALSFFQTAESNQ